MCRLKYLKTLRCIILTYISSSLHTPFHTFECVMSHIHFIIVSYTWMRQLIHASSDTFECIMLYRPHIHFIIIAYTIWYFNGICHISYGCETWRVRRWRRELSETCHMYERGMSDVWTSHVTRWNESCHTDEWVRSHIWVSHVTHLNESCHKYERVLSNVEMSHLSHEWMSDVTHGHVTHMNESCHTSK